MVETEIQKFRREFFESLSEEGYRVYQKFKTDYLMKKHSEQVTHNCELFCYWWMGRKRNDKIILGKTIKAWSRAVLKKIFWKRREEGRREEGRREEKKFFFFKKVF